MDVGSLEKLCKKAAIDPCERCHCRPDRQARACRWALWPPNVRGAEKGGSGAYISGRRRHCGTVVGAGGQPQAGARTEEAGRGGSSSEDGEAEELERGRAQEVACEERP